jgi:glutathione S-transferase
VLEFGVDNKKPEYLAINPFGTMPCLIDNTTIVIESMTILRYLCRTQKSCAKYYPTVKKKYNKYINKDPKEALKVDIYMDWHHSGTRPPCVGFFGASIGWKIFGGK